MQVAVMCMFLGIVGGFIYSFLQFLIKIFNNNKILTIFCDLISSIACGTLFILCIIKYNSGIIRLYTICAFVLGILIEIVSIGNLLDFLGNFIYTKINKVAKLVKLPLIKRGKDNESRPT